MKKTRGQVLASIGKGLLCAVALTLGCMALVAALALWLPISDAMLTALNQVMKAASVLLGARVAIGRGGQRGFVTGMTIAALYMTAGYACYVALGGNAFNSAQMLGEVLIGAAIGATAGAVISNLPPKKARRMA